MAVQTARHEYAAPQSVIWGTHSHRDLVAHSAIARRVTVNPCYTWIEGEQCTRWAHNPESLRASRSVHIKYKRQEMEMNTYVVKCSHCGQYGTCQIKGSDLTGKAYKCRRCGKSTTVRNKEGMRAIIYGPYDTRKAVAVVQQLQQTKEERKVA